MVSVDDLFDFDNFLHDLRLNMAGLKLDDLCAHLFNLLLELLNSQLELFDLHRQLLVGASQFDNGLILLN